MRVQWRNLGSAFTSKAWPVWLLSIGFLFSWVVGYLFAFLTIPFLPTQVRYAGVSLEILGFALVAVGIRGTRKLFNRPSLAASVIEWCKAVVDAVRTTRHESISTATGRFNLRLPHIKFEGTGTVRDSSLEERLAILQRDLHSLRDTVQRNSHAFKKLARILRILHKYFLPEPKGSWSIAATLVG